MPMSAEKRKDLNKQIATSTMGVEDAWNEIQRSQKARQSDDFKKCCNCGCSTCACVNYTLGFTIVSLALLVNFIFLVLTVVSLASHFNRDPNFVEKKLEDLFSKTKVFNSDCNFSNGFNVYILSLFSGIVGMVVGCWDFVLMSIRCKTHTMTNDSLMSEQPTSKYNRKNKNKNNQQSIDQIYRAMRATVLQEERINMSATTFFRYGVLGAVHFILIVFSIIVLLGYSNQCQNSVFSKVIICWIVCQSLSVIYQGFDALMRRYGCAQYNVASKYSVGDV